MPRNGSEALGPKCWWQYFHFCFKFSFRLVQGCLDISHVTQPLYLFVECREGPFDGSQIFYLFQFLKILSLLQYTIINKLGFDTTPIKATSLDSFSALNWG